MENTPRLIDLRLESYFPLSPVSFVFGIFGAAVLASTSWSLLAPVWILLLIALHLPHYRLLIDSERKMFMEYFYIWGMRKGMPVAYGEIKYIFIRKNRVSSGGFFTMRGSVPVQLTDPYHDAVFDAFIVFDKKTKVKLLRRDRKEIALAEVKKIAHALNVRISDQTGEKPLWVD